MEPESSLPHSQQPATCLFWARSIHVAPSNFLKVHFHIILASKPGSSKRLFPSVFPIKILYAPLPICSTCPAHPILLDLITRTIFHQEYRPLSSSDYNGHTHSKNAAFRSMIQSARRLIHKMLYVRYNISVTGQLKCDGTRAETRVSLSAKRTSPFNSWRMKNQLDVTCYFISLIMRWTCFGH